MIGISPEDVFPDVLCSLDEHLPDDKRVRLTLRTISSAAQRQYREALRAIPTKPDGTPATADEENMALNDVLRRILVGWTNCPYPFTDDGLDEALSTASKYTLARELPSLAFIGEREKKASRSQPKSVAGESAVPAVAANASTLQTKPAPS